MNQRHFYPRSLLKALSFTVLAAGLAACGGSSTSSNNIGGNNPDPLPDPEPTPVNVELDFLVQSHDGARLSDVSLTLDEITVESDSEGLVQFSMPSQNFYVVRAEADGYISQAVKVDAEEDAVMPIRLMPVKQTLSLNDIEAARTLSATDLGARITFPANAFVTPDGAPASGNASIQVTPWDITSGELNAMPGNGQAIDAMGQPTELISAGMITVDVHNDAGEYLQLADNASAEIQMDLPQASINNVALEVGSTIPMWHFDEDLGEWIEDDSTLGTVVESATSPVGLAVRAEVSHFSTWNWDFKFDNGGSISVECRLADNSSVPCGINAEVILDDGSVFTRASQLPEGGSTIVNMPNSATINWNASSAGGFLADLTTDMSSDVIIELGDPSTNNFVRCLLPDGSGVACSVTLTDGTNSMTQTLPASGATVVTGWPNLDEFSQLVWVVDSLTPISYNGQQVLVEGSATSDITGAVDIDLNITPVDQVEVECLSESGTPIPCTVDLVAFLSDGTQYTETDIAVAQNQMVSVPSEATLIQWSASSNAAYSENGQFVEFAGSMETGMISNLAIILDQETVIGTSAQSIQIYCSNNADTAAATCDMEVFLEGGQFTSGVLTTFTDVPVGDQVTVEFPEGLASEGEWVYLSATADDAFASSFSAYGTLTEGEVIELELQCVDAVGGNTCP